MSYRSLSCTLLMLLLLTGTVGAPWSAIAGDEDPAGGIGVTLLLPPNATPSLELQEALSEMKRELKAAGFEVLAQGEYNPQQKLKMVEKGSVTGLVAYESGDDELAVRVRELLLPRYPEMIVEPAPRNNSPFPEGTLGLLVPEIVILVVVPEVQPPPWKLYLEDITVEVDGGISGADVRGLFEDRKQDVIACWPKAVARGKRMEGHVLVKVTVDPGGEPVISSILESPGLGDYWVDCVSEVYLGWTFPSTTDGRSAKVTIGVRFVVFELEGDDPPAEEPVEPPADDAAEPPADDAAAPPADDAAEPPVTE